MNYIFFFENICEICVGFMILLLLLIALLYNYLFESELLLELKLLKLNVFCYVNRLLGTLRLVKEFKSLFYDEDDELVIVFYNSKCFYFDVFGLK